MSKPFRLLASAALASTVVLAGAADAQRYYGRTALARTEPAAAAAPAPAKPLKCSSPRNGYAAGSNARRFLGNYATSALGLEACEAKGSAGDTTCSTARLANATSDGPAGSYNAFVQADAAIQTASSGWTAWSCTPA